MIAFQLFCLALIALVAGGIIHAAAPRWWRCSWCRCWFSDRGDVEQHKPETAPGVDSHGICPVCAEIFFDRRGGNSPTVTPPTNQ